VVTKTKHTQPGGCPAHAWPPTLGWQLNRGSQRSDQQNNPWCNVWQPRYSEPLSPQPFSSEYRPALHLSVKLLFSNRHIRQNSHLLLLKLTINSLSGHLRLRGYLPNCGFRSQNRHGRKALLGPVILSNFIFF